MIQRIQTIFLLLAGAALLSLFAIPFATSEVTDTALFADKVYNIMDNPILLILTALGGGIALINIFLFKNRPLQLKLDYLIITLSILLPAIAIFLVFKSGGETSTQMEITENYFGIGMPLLAIIFTILASRFIGKDHKLVKSMDRLR